MTFSSLKLGVVRISLWATLFFIISVIYARGYVNGGVPKWVVIHAAALVAAVAYVKEGWRWHWPLIALVAYGGMSLLWSPDWRAGGLYFERWLALSILCLAWARWGGFLPEICTLSLVAVLGMAAFVPEYNGSFGNENFAAEYALLCLPFAGWAVYQRRGVVRWCAALSLAASLVYLLVFNDSKLEYPAFYGFILCFLLWKRWWVRSALWILIPINLIVYFRAEFMQIFWPNLVARIELWVPAIKMWLAHPIFGTGLGGFDYWFFKYWERLPIGSSMGPLNYPGAAHNEYFDFLAQFGLVGVALGVWLLWSVRSTMGLWMLAACSMFGFPLQVPGTAFLGAIFLGESLRQRRLSCSQTRSDGQWRPTRSGMSTATSSTMPATPRKGWFPTMRLWRT